MEQRRREADVAEPVVQREQLHAPPRKPPERVVAGREQQSQQDLRGEDADGDEPDDGGNVYRRRHVTKASTRRPRRLVEVTGTHCTYKLFSVPSLVPSVPTVVALQNMNRT